MKNDGRSWRKYEKGEFDHRNHYTLCNFGSADLVGWYVRQIKNKVVPLQHGTYQAASCHPARGTNR